MDKTKIIAKLQAVAAMLEAGSSAQYAGVNDIAKLKEELEASSAIEKKSAVKIRQVIAEIEEE